MFTYRRKDQNLYVKDGGLIMHVLQGPQEEK